MIEPDRSNHHEIGNSVEEKHREHKRMVKLGDPTTTIVEFACRKIEALHDSYRSKRSYRRVKYVCHVSDRVLKKRSIPVIFL